MSKTGERLEGSPPRRRGKGFIPNNILCCNRITPAWAGKSGPHIHQRSIIWDHPRMGGEKKSRPTATQSRTGSPPHGRGKVCARIRIAPVRGITPAWAGKRHLRRRTAWNRRDHPRVGGEKRALFGELVYPLGSPPRRRGKDGNEVQLIAAEGITPAWAGKSLFCFTAAVPIQDHPRMGGEKYGQKVKEEPRGGSPPHGRGKVDEFNNWETERRITPAWAGKRAAIGGSSNP